MIHRDSIQQKYRALRISLLVLLLSACSEPIIIAPDAILPDGSEYSGDTLDGKFHGQGVLKFPDGSFYKGNFADGLFHGQGYFKHSNGTSYEGVFLAGDASGQFEILNTEMQTHYEGEARAWQYHGHGKFKGPTHEYEGQFANALFEGKGVYIGADGLTYDGDFKGGTFHGFGKQESSQGWVYEGEFANGTYSGQGKYTYANGTTYEGEFRQGKSHGKGKETRHDGGVYEGEFVNGLYHGKGLYTQDNGRYEGDFVAGVFSGNGKYVDYTGNQYSGEVADWQANGKGKLTTPDGTISEGNFENGLLNGHGRKRYTDGSVYEGEFEYGEPDGTGQKRFADGRVYSGEFTYGRFDGKGTLTSIKEDGSEEIVKGKWRNGKIAFNEITGARMHEQAELALEHHQMLLQQSLQAVPEGIMGQKELYFIGLAGDGRQSVFLREVEYAAKVIEKKYAVGLRQVMLVNHHDTARQYPMATRRSLATTLNAVGEKMNPQEDILFLFLTSHGSSDYEFALRHDSIKLPPLSARELASTLEKTNIKKRVIVISACYSGGFIDHLKNDDTIILTAAAADKRSFGCSEESDMTNFGKALFQETLVQQTDLPLTEAFEKAKEIVLRWERDGELEASEPQIHAPASIVSELKSIADSNQ